MTARGNAPSSARPVPAVTFRHPFGGLDTGKKKATDVLNVFYVNKPHPKIIHSAATQNPTSGLVSVDYEPPFFLIEYAGMENVTLHQQ